MKVKLNILDNMRCVCRMCEPKYLMFSPRSCLVKSKWVKVLIMYQEKVTCLSEKPLANLWYVCFQCFLPFTEIQREVKCKTTNNRTGHPQTLSATVSSGNTQVTASKHDKMLCRSETRRFTVSSQHPWTEEFMAFHRGSGSFSPVKAFMCSISTSIFMFVPQQEIRELKLNHKPQIGHFKSIKIII